MNKCIVINVKTDTDVINKKRGYVYIGRGSKWGNPFLMKDYTDKEKNRVCDEYEKWFWTQPQLVNSLHELAGQRLGCYCKPKRCHGDFLAKLVNDKYRKEK